MPVVRDRLGPDHNPYDLAELAASGELSTDGHRAIGAFLLPPQVRPAARSLEGISLRGARAPLQVSGEIRMRIILTDRPKREGDVRPLFRAPIECFGGTACSTIELTGHGYTYPMNGEIFTIMRRFACSRANYLRRYIQPFRTN